ncbi:MAG: phosphatidate cytidylyltransferase [Chitinophagaceae bacterium]|nr:phosphatidate cytidylyltransferase [Chitinophagaceae bacterium]
MQKLNVTLLAALMLTLSSCEVVGGIFKAGVWTGLLIVAVVIVLVIWLISKFMR